MSCGNLYKNILQNAVCSFIDNFNAEKSSLKTLNDDQMECMQFGICSFVPNTSEEIPYFHY